MTLAIELIVVAVLILLNGYFVAAEYGLVTVRRTRMLELEQKGSLRARQVLQITESPPRFITAMQLGVTLTSLATVLEQASKKRSTRCRGVLAVTLAYLILTFFHVVIGELVPKAIALGHPERTALTVAWPVRMFFVVAMPLIWLLRRSTRIVLGLVGLEEPGATGAVHSEAELRMLLNESTSAEINGDKMLYKVFAFADKEVSDVMVPRPEVVALSVELPPEQALQAVLDSPYTRYPVYRGSLDEIVGVLHVRDLIEAMHERGIAEVQVEDLLRPAYMVPETKDLAALLTEFRNQNQHMAIVLDEYGNMEGIVTLEDVLEEIVGEIEDEFDLPDESVERIDENTIRIDGTFPIDDFNEQFGSKLPQEDYHTVAGFVFGLLGRGAEPGDEVDYDGLHFRVDEVEGSRIQKLTVTFAPPPPEQVAAEG
jgi:putative hemolysin